jgi:hypothetical protein
MSCVGSRYYCFAVFLVLDPRSIIVFYPFAETINAAVAGLRAVTRPAFPGPSSQGQFSRQPDLFVFSCSVLLRTQPAVVLGAARLLIWSERKGLLLFHWSGVQSYLLFLSAAQAK